MRYLLGKNVHLSEMLIGETGEKKKICYRGVMGLSFFSTMVEVKRKDQYLIFPTLHLQ